MKGQQVILWLKKAMNGLRRAPLLWFLELQRTIRDLGGDETFESTLFRVKTDTQFLLVLVYVDDLLIASNDVEGGENFLRALQKIWKIKRTGSIPSGRKGLLEFLGRTIYRRHDSEECLYFEVSRSYMEGIFVSWEEKLKESTGSMQRKSSGRPNCPPRKHSATVGSWDNSHGQHSPGQTLLFLLGF